MKKNVIICFGMILATFLSVRAQEDVNLFSYWSYYSDVENVLYKHFCEVAFRQLESRRSEISRLRTKEEWLMRQAIVRNKLSGIIGPFPEKTPLNVQVTGILQRNGYRIEKTLYESVPGYYIPGALYIPDGIRGKAPAIFYACGHSREGFRHPTYQHIIINLVKKGFVVFTIDPMGQGERYEYWNVEKDQARFPIPDHEHSYAGAQCILAGYSTARYFIWDVIRGIDYLLSRPEVDPGRLGITGRSGGGNLSAYLGALDDRIYAAAPECYITSYKYLFKSIGPQCAEQNLYQMIARGFDHADFIEVRAPKPTMIISTTRDFFSIQGTRESFREAAGIYEAYGAGEMLTMVEDHAEHTSTRKNREAMYAFFQEHLDNPGVPEDLEVDIPSEEELLVTSTGHVVSALGGQSVHSLNRTEAQYRIAASDLAGISTGAKLDSLKAAAARNAGFSYPEESGTPVFSGRTVHPDYVTDSYLIPGSGAYMLPVLLFRPVLPSEKGAVLLLHSEGMKHAVQNDSLIYRLVDGGYTVLSMDLPGIGNMGPGYLNGDSYIGGVSYNQWFAAVLTGGSFVGLRAEDIIRCARFLDSSSGGTGKISAIAVGPLGSDLLHAALFEPVLDRISTIGTFLSFEDIVNHRFYEEQFIPFTVPGAIGESDLPELIAGLCPRNVLLMDPLCGDGSEADAGTARSLMRLPLQEYTEKGVPGAFQVATHLDEIQVPEYLIDWLE